MLVDRGGLWYKVLVVRYGEEDGGRSGSSWWKEVVKIRDGTVGGDDGWFTSCVGDDADTLFWHDRWCGDVPFRVRFGRLFDLALNKSITVKEMFDHGWGDEGEA